MGFPVEWPPPRWFSGTAFGSWEVAYVQARLWSGGPNCRRPLLRRRNNAWEIWL